MKSQKTKSKSFKKARYRSYGKVIIINYKVFIHFQVFYNLLYTYGLDQTKNLLNLTKSQHYIKKLVILSLPCCLFIAISH